MGTIIKKKQGYTGYKPRSLDSLESAGNRRLLKKDKYGVKKSRKF